MKTKIKNSQAECQALMEIQIPAENVDKAFGEVYAEISKRSNVPGFRTGKAPIEIVRKHYQGAAQEEVLKRVITDGYSSAIQEHKVDALGLPEITDVSELGEGKALSFKAKVITRPQVKLKDYRGLAITRKKAEVKEEDIEKTLNDLRQIKATYAPVEGRAAQMGDYAVCDLETFVDGKSVHQKRENLWILLDTGFAIPELHAGIVGMRALETKDIAAVLPPQYPDKSLAGKKAVYRVTVKEIKERALPALDDAFAKDLGKEGFAELRKEIVRELEERMKMNAEIEAENSLLKKVIDSHPFAVPAVMVERQLAHMVEEAKGRLKQKGVDPAEIDKKDKEFTEKFRDDAARQVRLFFILDEIARKEGIEASADDVENSIKSIAERTGKSPAEVRAYYEKEDMVSDLEQKIRESKTVELIMKSASITESAG